MEKKGKFVGNLVQPLSRAAAPGLKPLRLPRVRRGEDTKEVGAKERIGTLGVAWEGEESACTRESRNG